MFNPLIASDSEFKLLDWKEAQLWCNFVLFEPKWLPSGMQIMQKQLRPESLNKETSTYRCLLAGQNRKISIKQFLYDWAPPAYDHPSLWRNNKISSIENTPTPKPFPVNRDIVWIGLNYKRQRAASFNIKRTMIEVTSVEGNFTDEELVSICSGIILVDREVANRILKTPFASLCYSNRNRETASEVPLSYWKYNRRPVWHVRPSHIPEPTPVQIPPSYSYLLNSTFRFGDPVFETEYYFEHRDLPGSYIRLLTTPYGQKDSIPYPPSLGDQTCTNAVINVRGIDVYYAYLTEAFGPHEAVWQHKDRVIMLLVKPAEWSNASWFLRLLSDIVF